ncbi:MAG: hypothetical protein ACHQNE_01115 [Candidatus Kapaibacterium sp.]
MQRDASEIIGLERLPEHQWAFYDDVLAAARGTGKPFALGGALAWATYCGHYRNTKDIDLYVPLESKQDFIDAVTTIGAADYYNTLTYDRGWIYRSTRDGCIADLIWAMANYVRPIDEDYFNGETTLALRGNSYRVLPAEELILNKLYIMNRTRCDWFDVFNLLYMTNGALDWDRLIAKLGDDKILLGSVLRIFAWLCPGRVELFSSDLWEKLAILKPDGNGPEVVERRINYLDSRPWFVPTLKPGERPFAEGG